MKPSKNTNEIVNVDATETNEIVNVDATETTATETTATETTATVEKVLTVAEVKAQNILRAKLPALHDLNFNFEKRTGSFFTASIVKMYDKEGSPILENGAHKEKIVRTVIKIENERGEFLPEYVHIEQEANQKRAAAFVLNADNEKKKLQAAQQRLFLELEENKQAIETFDSSLEIAKEVVDSVILPERTASERLNLTTKLTESTTKLNVISERLVKLTAMLKAAGYSEEEIEQQING